MIINIPTESDYFKIANNNLNIVWDNIFRLISDYTHVEEFQSKDIHYYLNCSYHRHSKATWLGLIQTASELYLKGRILSMGSQYLIDDTKWNTKRINSDDEVSFCSLKSINAVELIDKYNDLFDEKVGEIFGEIFEELRVVRNQIMHSALPEFEFSIYEIIKFILEIQRQFNIYWSACRAQYLYTTRRHFIEYGNMDYPEPCLTSNIFDEFEILFHMLGKQDLERYFHYNSNDNRFHCPSCMDDISNLSYGELSGAHTFKPVKMEDNILTCLVCGWDGSYNLSTCVSEKCDSNIISDEWNVCLCCGEWQGADEQ